MLIIDADDFYMKLKKMLIQWISNFGGQVHLQVRCSKLS